MFKKSNHQSSPQVVAEKTRYRYIPVRESLESDELGTYISYGICVRREKEEEIEFISDVSTEFEKVKRLAHICTEKQLSPEHLSDVIEDFLSDEESILV